MCQVAHLTILTHIRTGRDIVNAIYSHAICWRTVNSEHLRNFFVTVLCVVVFLQSSTPSSVDRSSPTSAQLLAGNTQEARQTANRPTSEFIYVPKISHVDVQHILLFIIC